MLTVNGAGKASNGTRRTFNMTLSPVQWEVLTATGLRSVWAIDLPKGRHQLRVASIHPATGRGGSVYLDVDVSEAIGAAARCADRVALPVEDADGVCRRAACLLDGGHADRDTRASPKATC